MRHDSTQDTGHDGEQRTEQDMTGPNRNEQNRTGQDRIGHDVEHDRTGDTTRDT